MHMAIKLQLNYILYSRKIWRWNKFGDMAVYLATAKLKSANTLYLHYTYGDPLPNRQLKIRQCFYNGDLGPNRQIYFPPNLNPANISGYTVACS